MPRASQKRQVPMLRPEKLSVFLVNTNKESVNNNFGNSITAAMIYIKITHIKLVQD